MIDDVFLENMTHNHKMLVLKGILKQGIVYPSSNKRK